MTSDRQAFIAAIVARPNDDAPRLIFADWMEEHGEPERAEFVRIHCERQRLGPCRGLPMPECVLDADGPLCPVCRLMRRGGQLLAEHGRAWMAPLVHAIKGPDSKHFDWVATHADFHSTRTVRWQWKRGFPDWFSMSANDWLTYAREFTDFAPVLHVRLTSWPSIGHCNDWEMERYGTCSGDGFMAVGPQMLAIEWPDITFELPSEFQAARLIAGRDVGRGTLAYLDQNGRVVNQQMDHVWSEMVRHGAIEAERRFLEPISPVPVILTDDELALGRDLAEALAPLRSDVTSGIG